MTYLIGHLTPVSLSNEEMALHSFELLDTVLGSLRPYFFATSIYLFSLEIVFTNESISLGVPLTMPLKKETGS